MGILYPLQPKPSYFKVSLDYRVFGNFTGFLLKNLVIAIAETSSCQHVGSEDC